MGSSFRTCVICSAVIIIISKRGGLPKRDQEKTCENSIAVISVTMLKPMNVQKMIADVPVSSGGSLGTFVGPWSARLATNSWPHAHLGLSGGIT